MTVMPNLLNTGTITGNVRIRSGWRARGRRLWLLASNPAYRNAADGAARLDGVTAVPWADLSDGTYWMRRDCYTRSIDIAAGVVLVVNGYRIFTAGGMVNHGTISASA